MTNIQHPGGNYRQTSTAKVILLLRPWCITQHMICTVSLHLFDTVGSMRADRDNWDYWAGIKSPQEVAERRWSSSERAEFDSLKKNAIFPGIFWTVFQGVLLSLFNGRQKYVPPSGELHLAEKFPLYNTGESVQSCSIKSPISSKPIRHFSHLNP